MLVAGTAIGAGMLGLPMISAGMWFSWSVIVLAASWFFMFRSSQAILEINLHFRPGQSFHTLVCELLGRSWSRVNGFAVCFVLYTLVYAYVSGGGSVLQQALGRTIGFEPPRILAGLIFSLLLAACVWWSSRAVDRLSTILMAGMVVTLVMSMSGMLGSVSTGCLFTGEGRAVFIWGALSTYLTSFCFHASVPSLVKYIGKDARTINSCLLCGTVIAMLCYLAWILAVDGNIPRQDFRKVIDNGGNVGDLLSAAGARLDSSALLRLLEAFSFLAVATSFLGAGLGLFDYMADLCGFDDSRPGRTKTVVITFAPPMLCGLAFPNGFLAAIGWAGLAAAVWSVIVPALLLRAGRKRFAGHGYSAPGGRMLVPALLLYGLLIAVCHTLFVLDMLPMYR